MMSGGGLELFAEDGVDSLVVRSMGESMVGSLQRIGPIINDPHQQCRHPSDLPADVWEEPPLSKDVPMRRSTYVEPSLISECQRTRSFFRYSLSSLLARTKPIVL